MQKHYYKECRASIEVVTSNHAYCRVCGQGWHKTYNWGKDGWGMDKDDNRLSEYVATHKAEYEEAKR